MYKLLLGDHVEAEKVLCSTGSPQVAQQEKL